jgi:hypothetical protein
MTDLRTLGSLPGGDNVPVNETVGPYVNYWDTDIQLTGIFKGNSDDCPAGTTYSWDDGSGLLICSIFLDK